MKNKKLIFGVLFAGVLALNTLVLSTTNNNDLQLNSLFTLASAQAEDGEDGEINEKNTGYLYWTQGATKDEREEKRACWTDQTSSGSASGSYNGASGSGSGSFSQTNPSDRYEIICPFGYENCTPVGC